MKKRNHAFIFIIFAFAFVLSISGCCKKESTPPKETPKKEAAVSVVKFPEIEGWELGEVKTYKGEELYQPIDGEADRFINYGFKEAYFTSYSLKNGKGIIDTQIYSMFKDEYAYGLFTLYDSKELKHDIYETGFPGCSAGSDSILFFCYYNYFGRISLHDMDPDESLLKNFHESMYRAIMQWNLRGDTMSPVPFIESLMPKDYIKGTFKYFRNWQTYRELNYNISKNIFSLSEQIDTGNLPYAENTNGSQAAYTLIDEKSEKDIFIIIQYPKDFQMDKTFKNVLDYYKGKGFEIVSLDKGYIAVNKDGKAFARFANYTSSHYTYIYGVLDISSEERADQIFPDEVWSKDTKGEW